jgi:hypothetical protein
MRLLLALLLFVRADSLPEVRDKIVAAYQQSLDALRRGDADAALQIDMKDWVSITPGRPEVRRRERDKYLRQNIDSQKPPAGWVAIWKPDYEHNGTSTGIQVYDVKVEGNCHGPLPGRQHERQCLGRIARAGYLDRNAAGLETQPARKTHSQ